MNGIMRLLGVGVLGLSTAVTGCGKNAPLPEALSRYDTFYRDGQITENEATSLLLNEFDRNKDGELHGRAKTKALNFIASLPTKEGEETNITEARDTLSLALTKMIARQRQSFTPGKARLHALRLFDKDKDRQLSQAELAEAFDSTRVWTDELSKDHALSEYDTGLVQANLWIAAQQIRASQLQQELGFHRYKNQIGIRMNPVLMNPLNFHSVL